MSRKVDQDSIASLASGVVDNGRRGDPKPGCDCMQCFGYCMVDADQALRERSLMNDHNYRPVDGAALDLNA